MSIRPRQLPFSAAATSATSEQTWESEGMRVCCRWWQSGRGPAGACGDIFSRWKRSKLMLWLLGGYLWLFLHRPFEVWPGLGDLHVERVYMIVTCLYWLAAAEKTWTSNRLNWAFAGFWCVTAASCAFSPFNSNVEDYFKISLLYLLLITTVRSERDLRFIVSAFLIAMGPVYGAIPSGSTFAGPRVPHGHRADERVDIAHCDPNTFAANILYALPLLYPVWGLCPAVAPRAAGGLRGAVAGVHFVDRFAKRLCRPLLPRGPRGDPVQAPTLDDRGRAPSGGAPGLVEPGPFLCSTGS